MSHAQGRLVVLAGVALAALGAGVLPAAAQTGGSGTSGGSSDTGATDSGLPGLGGGTPSVPPIAGGLVPSTGFDPNQSDLRNHLLNSFGQNATQPQPGNSGPAWQFSPAISVTESLTDNADQFAGYGYGLGNKRDDAITLITPSIIVLGDTERFRVNLNYAPTGVIYAENSDYSQFRQQFYGSVLGIAVPDLFYIDTRGSISQNPIYGGTGLLNTDTLPPSQRETTSQISVSPYLSHTFGGTGTAQAGVSYIYSATDAPGYLNSDSAVVPVALPYNYGSQWLATRRVFASFRTGEDYGRFQDEISTDNSFYDGSGASRDAHRILLTDDVSYAINRFVSGLGEFGYENLSYPASGYGYVGGVWSAGVRVTPNAQSSITLEYRRIDGITAPYVFGYWQITPRIRVFGSYSEGITTFQQDEQSQLLSGTNDQTGVAASALVAAPLVDNASLFGANQALTNTARANLSVTYITDRDVVTGAFNHQRSSLVGNLLGLPSNILALYGISNAELAQFGLLTTQTSSTTYATLSWHHDIQENWSADAQIGYSRSSVAQAGFSDYDAIQVSIGLNHTFSRTLTGRVAYTGNYTTGNNNGIAGYGQNTDTISFTLRKSF